MPAIPTTTQYINKTAANSRLRGSTDSADSHFAITASDTVQQPYFARGIFIGTGGNISAELYDPTTGDYSIQVYKNIPSGSVLQISPRRIMSTNTTAADMIGLL